MALGLRAPHEELDVDQLAEAELGRLQRQYRIMEGDRQSYMEETRHFMHKQRRMIRELEREKNELLTDLRLCRSTRNEDKDSESKNRVTRLLELADKYEADIRAERAQVAELESQIGKLEKEVMALRKTNITDRQSLLISAESKKVVANLENRLGVATVKFNKMLAENSELREELDHLIKERSHFNQLYQQLMSRLQSGKKVIVDLIEQATLAYDQREEAQSKLQALKDRGRVDLSVHSQEMRELQRQLDHNAKLQEFLGIKGQKRVMADLEERERQKKQNQKESQEQMIAMYQVILEKIKACSGEAEVDRLSAQFIKQEEENFALFNYVNELNNELELLQDQVNELKSKIEEQHAEDRKRAARHKETLGELDAEVSFRMRDSDQSQDKLDATNKILSNLLEGIENIFNLVRCDNAPILELLGNSSNVSSHSVMLYLGIIERRINDLLRLVLYRNKIAAMG